MGLVIQTDRTKSVCSRCVIENFKNLIVVLCCRFGFFYLLQNHRIWVNSIRDDTCTKLMLVRGVLELTVRQNLHFFYQCRYYLVLYSECFTNTSNPNQFDTSVVIRVDFNNIRWYCKTHFSSSVRLPRSQMRCVSFRGMHRAWVRIALETHFISNFSLPSRSSLVGEARTNEIKHDIHPE